MSGFKIEHRHSLSDGDAKARVRALGEYLTNRHKIGVTWDAAGECASVSGTFKMLVDIEGAVTFAPGVVLFDGKDPGFLWRGKAKSYLEGKLARYLDAAVPLDTLPRS